MARAPFDFGIPGVQAEKPLERATDYERIENVPPGAFGAFQARSLEQGARSLDTASNELSQTALRVQEFQNNTVTDQAFTQLMNGMNNLTYGNPADPNAPKGLYSLTGEDALKAGPQVAQQIEALRSGISGGLQNDAQRLRFNEDSRRLIAYKSSEISAHLLSQQRAYGEEVFKDSLAAKERDAGLSYNSDDVLLHNMADARAAGIANAKTRLGESADPAMLSTEGDAATGVVVRGAIMGALSKNDSSRAQQILDKFGMYLDPAERARLSEHVQNGASEAGIAEGISTVMGNTPMATGRALPAGASREGGAIIGVEGSGPNVYSHAGAGGVYQITPGLFEDNARPGERFSREADRERVSERVIAKYKQEYGDPDRVAVAWFSGTDNVAPPGSPTPYINGNKGDHNLTVAQYVDRFRAFYGSGSAGVAPASTPPVASGPAEVGQFASVPGGGETPLMPSGTPVFGPDNKPMVIPASAGTPAPEAATAAPSEHHPEVLGQEAVLMQRAREEAWRRFPDPQQEKQRRALIDGVYQEIQQANTLQSKYEAEQKKAIEDGQQAAGNDVVKQLMLDPSHFDQKTIANNPYLTYQQKIDLWKLSDTTLKGFGNKDTKAFGPGFFDLLHRTQLPDGDPNRITDPTQLWSRVSANGDLTVAGVEKLTGIIEKKRTPDGAAETKLIDGALAYARHEITYELDLGNGAKIDDPKGVALFNTGFLPAFFKAYDDARAAGASPYALLSKDSKDFITDKIISAYKRSQAQVSADQLASPAGEALGAPKAGAFDLPVLVNSYKAGKVSQEQARQQVVDAYNKGLFSSREAALAAMVELGYPMQAPKAEVPH